jgi:hypothetical protein
MQIRKALASSLALALVVIALSTDARAQCVLDGERVVFTGQSFEALLFGLTVLLDADGDTALFPNYGDETNGPFSGAVHVWRNDGAGWVPQLSRRSAQV